MTALRSTLAALVVAAGVIALPAHGPASVACEGGLCEVCPLIADAARGVAVGPIQCLA